MSTTEINGTKPDLENASGWSPIETAPRDGTDIIVYRPKHDGDYIPKVGTDYWMTGRFYGPCWAKSRRDCEPTHWMPLPEAPK